MKVNISQLFEASKSLSTQAGAQLKDFIEFSAGAFDQVVGALKKQLTFTDNFFCDDKTIELTHNIAQAIEIGNKTPIGLIPLRVDSTEYKIDSYNGFIDNSGKYNIIMSFSPTPSSSLRVRVVILYQ